MWPWTRWQVPVVLVDKGVDDATAALTMVLRYHRRSVSCDEVRQALIASERPQVASSSSTFSALAIVNAAAHFGLRARGVQLGRENQLYSMPRPSIMHMRQPGDTSSRAPDHDGAGYFAVLTSTAEPYEMRWIDPYEGVRRNTARGLFALCTGAILQFAPGRPLPRARLAKRLR